MKGCPSQQRRPGRPTPGLGLRMMSLLFLGFRACATGPAEECLSRPYDTIEASVASAADCELGLCPFECIDGGGICSAEAGIYCEECGGLLTYLDAKVHTCPGCEITEGTGGAILLTCP